MVNWELNSCCNNGQVTFLVTIGVFTVVILVLWRTVLLLPFKLITVFLHEASHAIACKLTCGHVLVDAPDMVRGQMNFKRLTLTDITIDIPRVPKNKWVDRSYGEGCSSWGRKLIVQKRRASLNDFDRFKLMLAKIKRSGVIKQELAKLKKENAS
ncbi:hypothetical protein ES332_D11G270200v1 [Gossypium tomentosum]|uniref:Large ribosomal subunit protein eL14 domain-containing protein n=1 Tax=Gossypium tomentosum TaxID=34277 RepID=A0A5D2ITP3_GOSTO|nr:hypothetical protein ES332_D11G270200v1 [Gossypium tomentosum]